MLSAILKIIAWVTGFLQPKSDPTQVQLADSNARAQEQLTQAENTNATLSQAAAARANADAASMRAVVGNTSPEVDAAANERLRQQFPGEFGD
jgi:hypothetical protein